MLRAILVALLMIVGAKLVSAQEVDQAGIETTIEAQMEAFRDQDAAAAFSLASPMIRSMFGSSDRFGMMVQQGYPMVWNNSEVQFMALRQERGRIIQRVRIRDGAGELHLLDYNMIELDSTWLIDGVQYIPMPGVSA